MCRYVCIALEAMEQLLLACHCQSINLLVESFLSTLRLLLEADNKPHLHILATNSVSNAHPCAHTHALASVLGAQELHVAARPEF